MTKLAGRLLLPVRNISRGLPTHLSRTTAAKSLIPRISHSQPKFQSQSLPLSTYSRLLNKSDRGTGYKSDKSDFGYLGSKPEVPLAMSFRSIGIRKNVKLLLFMSVCVLSTIQLFIWGEDVWKWWKNEEGDEV